MGNILTNTRGNEVEESVNQNGDANQGNETMVANKLYKLAKSYDVLNIVKNIERLIETVENVSETVHELYGITDEIGKLKDRVACLSAEVDKLEHKLAVGNKSSVQTQKADAYKASHGF